MDGRSIIATWKFSDPEDEHAAIVTIKASGLPIVTEIMTTLTLIRTAQFLAWFTVN